MTDVDVLPLSITPDERQRGREHIQELIHQLEQLTKTQPASDEQIKTSVITWEQRIFDRFGQRPREYIEKLRIKENNYKESLAAQIKSTTSTEAVPVITQKPPRPFDTLKVPMESTRQILRVLNVFGIAKKDQKLKEEFMGLFQRATQISYAEKHKTLTVTQVNEEIEQIKQLVGHLREKLQPNIDAIQHMLGASDLDEVMALQTQPFGLLQRILERKANYVTIHDRCQKASKMMGGGGGGGGGGGPFWKQ